MPQAIPLLLYAAGTYFGVAAVLVTVATIVSSLALSVYQRNKAKRAANAAFDSAQVDRLANIQNAVEPRKLLLGRLRTGGTVFERGTVGAYNEMLVMLVALAGHEIDGVERYYFNDQPVDADGSGNVLTAPYARNETKSYPLNPLQNIFLTGTSTVMPSVPNAGSVTVFRQLGPENGLEVDVPYTLSGSTVTIAYDPAYTYWVTYQTTTLVSKARVRPWLGAAGQPADPRMIGLFPGVWTTDHRATGVAYIICEFDYDETAFAGGIPTVTALVRGAKCYDPRTGLTQFTENPAIMMRHVITHPKFGRRTAMTAAEDARISAAANACDVGINYGQGATQTFRAATIIPFGQAARDALDDLAQAMGGQWAYAAGEFFVRAGVYQAPVKALTDADLAVVQTANDGSVSQSPITISPHRARNDKVNTVLPRIWDQAAGYVQTAIQQYQSAALVAADGVVLPQEVTMPAVFYAGQAYHIAGIMLRDGRDPLTVTLPFKLTAYPLELFDSVTLTLARYGWSAKEFNIIGRRLVPGGYVELTLKETAAAIFVYGADFVPSGYADNSGLPRPWDIYPPTITAVSSGESELVVQSDGTVINGVRVSWAAVQDQSILQGGHIDVRYVVVPDGRSGMVTVDGSETQALISGLPDGAAIVLSTRSRNDVAVSDWSLQVSHIVIGKTEPPPDITNLSISGAVLAWSLPRRVPDLAGFVFRFHYGVNLDWGSAAPLHDGIVTENPWEPKTRPGGVVTIMGKAIDTTGNVSKNTADIVMNLGDAPVANIVEQWDFEAMGWPYAVGEQSGWTLVLGDPSANALDSLYGTDNQSFYGADNDSFYDAGAYGQMVYVTKEVAINSALAGSIMTLETQVQGDDLRIDYRISGPGSLYETDNSSFYGPDADPFYGPPGAWQPWPGQLVAANEVYQFRVTIGASVDRGILQSMVLTIDAPDLEESIADLVISSGGTAIPYSKPFTSIKTVQATLQANGSSAETVEINKTSPLVPVIRAFNSTHTAVSGATADIVIRGY